VGKLKTRLIGALALATWAGCAAHAVQPVVVAPEAPPPAPPSYEPTARMINVQSKSGVPFNTIPAAFIGEAGLDDWTNQGLKTPYLFNLGPQCGDPVVVTDSSGKTAHGRLMVFRHRQGVGPAGRGDYRIEVPDERVDSAAAGRLTIHTELYKDATGSIFTAWAVVMSDQPVSCAGDSMSGGYAPPTPSYGPAPGPTYAPPPAAGAKPPATAGECQMAASHATTLARNEMRALILYGEPLSPTDRQVMFDAQVPKDLGVQAKRILEAPPAKRDALLAEVNTKFATDLNGVYVGKCASFKAPLIRCVLHAVSLAQQEACATDPANW
jgi:hypothetical protein